MKYKNFPSDTDVLHRVYISRTSLIPVKHLSANFESQLIQVVNVIPLYQDS